jgi:hypothetical protein
MIIDEISMMDSQMLARINNRCKVARALSPDSCDLFGGIPMVIFMGDFYQFAPVKGLPLWRKLKKGKEDEIIGQQIWRRFKEVIILDEQMRQADDLEFRALLHCARNAQLTRSDVDTLNFKVIESINDFPFYSMVSIVKVNVLRY